MNIDYAFCEAVDACNFTGITQLISFYDVMCEYIKKLKAQIDRNPFLELLKDITIVPGIGLLHVTEHREQCYPEYASTFIKHAGIFDGEIIETLWSQLNHCSSYTRNATLAHRAEILDDHMNDSNWQKSSNIGMWTLCTS